jgi:MarR family transcriptional regulator for hemolysin
MRFMESKKTELCMAQTIRRADRVVSQMYNEYLAPLGLRATQFSVLRVLDIKGTTTASQIREVLVMDQTTISRTLKPLVRDGYVTVAQGATRREKSLSLSKEGKKLYRQALGPWQEAQKMFKKKLGKGQDALLIELSRRVVTMKS